jgi:hypothetical protein
LFLVVAFSAVNERHPKTLWRIAQKEVVVAKGQMRSNKEKKKPKAAGGDKKKGGPATAMLGSSKGSSDNKKS